MIYLCGEKNRKISIKIYTILSLIFIMTGTLISSDFVWELTDMFNNLMVIPNVMALFALSGLVLSLIKK